MCIRDSSKGVEKEENVSDKKAADKTAKEDSQSAKENKKETSEKKQAEKRSEKKVDNSKPQVITVSYTHLSELPNWAAKCWQREAISKRT